MKNSHIEWTDHTFNPWEGCTKVSPGCAHCYAEARNARFGGGEAPNWGKGAPRRRTSGQNWNQPLKWNREAGDDQHAYCVEVGARFQESDDMLEVPDRPRVFCASLADWLDDEVDPLWLADLLNLIHTTPHLDWLLLSKRPQLWRARMEAVCEVDGDNRIAWNWLKPEPIIPANVWIGTTVEDQQRADERIPALLKIPARVRFLSCEPLLGAVTLSLKCPRDHNGDGDCDHHTRGCPKVDWVICGGESGPGARPMHLDWARSLRDQCAATGVAFHFKQWGEWKPCEVKEKTISVDTPLDVKTPREPELWQWSNARGYSARVGKAAAGRLLDGVEHNGLPDVRAV